MSPETEIAFRDFKATWHSRNPRDRVPSMLECFEAGAAHKQEEVTALKEKLDTLEEKYADLLGEYLEAGEMSEA